jgi:hypothetical protein
MRKEEQDIETRSKKLTRSTTRVAKIQERLPGLSAHIPKGDGGLCQCGEVHDGPADVMRAMLSGLTGGRIRITEVTREVGSEKKKRTKKTPN